MSWFGDGGEVRGGTARRILGERPAPHEVRVTPRDGFEEIQRQEMSRLFGLFTRARLALIPALVVLFAWTWWVDPTGWRIIILAVAVPVLAAIFVFEYRRWQRRGLSRHAIDRNLVVGILGVVTLSVVSGGLQSPFLPVMVVLTVAIGLFGSPAVATWLMGFEMFAVLTFTVLELTRGDGWLRIPALTGEGRIPAARTLTMAVTFTVLMAASRHLGRFVRRAFDAMLRRTVRAQTESLRAHAERAEELTALSAEIAHELKNPLASVKGLAGLLAPAVAGARGRSGWRCCATRWTACRPSSRSSSTSPARWSRWRSATTTPASCAGEVAALHEGLAHERGVEIEVAAEAPARGPLRSAQGRSRCSSTWCRTRSTPRRRRRSVRLRGRAEPGGGARVVVADRGRGLDPALGAPSSSPASPPRRRAAGWASPSPGPLARQHGGDAPLAARDGGGTVASCPCRATARGRPPMEAA